MCEVKTANTPDDRDFVKEHSHMLTDYMFYN